ncbi:MAG TPA: hypothetical protein VGS41_16865, partial [Chthonomonadales bacterium]|nr:hypothetical protein [Chthonomonadales bacterium]
AQSGLFDAVIVTYMSRLARGDAYTVAEWQLKEEGVTVEMVKENFTEDLAGYIGNTMTRFMDGMYPKMVSGWARTKQKQMVGHGYLPGALTPFGYRREDVPNPQIMGRAGNQPPKR